MYFKSCPIFFFLLLELCWLLLISIKENVRAIFQPFQIEKIQKKFLNLVVDLHLYMLCTSLLYMLSHFGIILEVCDLFIKRRCWNRNFCVIWGFVGLHLIFSRSFSVHPSKLIRLIIIFILNLQYCANKLGQTKFHEI